MTIKEMQERKKELGYSNEQIAALSGVPLGTVMKIFSGATKAPRRATIVALEKVLARPVYGDLAISPLALHGFSYPTQEEAELYGKKITYTRKESASLREMPPAYETATKKYTIDDYYELPDDQRVELIDGVFYNLAAPTYVHQEIIGELFWQMKGCEKKHPGACRVYISPCDVQLDADLYTMVQPDILVICDLEKRTRQRLIGAPDLCIEVLSPSSRSHDCIRKLNKYKNAGVREYWIVDPERLSIMVYVFENDSFHDYSFQDTVPVSISGGECSVDFKEIASALEGYKEK